MTIVQAYLDGMCTAYELGKQRGSSPVVVSAKAMAELHSVKETRIIRPTIPAPVILPDGSLRNMKWGFRRSFAPKAKGGKPTWRTIVNSREDKLDGRMWKTAFAQHRCLIPASSFYEWVKIEGKNVPLRVEQPSGETLWIAGIWEESDDGERFSMITTEPNGILSDVHDRMPAVLSFEQVPPFLAGDLQEFGPSAVPLQYQEAANFLKAGKILQEPPTQAELF